MQGKTGAYALAKLRQCSGTKPVSACTLDAALIDEIDRYSSQLHSTRPGLPENDTLYRFLHSESLSNLLDCIDRELPRATILEARYQIDDCARASVCAGLHVPTSISRHSRKVLTMIFERNARETALLRALQATLAQNETVVAYTVDGTIRTLGIFEARAELIPFFEKR